jgi:hypothetical protein
MPRKNTNAGPRDHAPVSRWPIEEMTNYTWRMAELRAMKEYLNQKNSVGTTKESKPKAILKTTAEQIVRDFRRSEGFNIYETASMIQPFCRKIRRPFFLKRWFNAINWDLFYDWGGKVFKWGWIICIAALVVGLIYLGIIIFGPFTAEDLLK